MCRNSKISLVIKNAVKEQKQETVYLRVSEKINPAKLIP